MSPGRAPDASRAKTEPGSLEHLVERMIGAIRLAPETYAEIARDPAATRLGLVVLLAVGLAQGIGSFAEFGRAGVVLSLGSAYLGWICSSLLVWLIGTRLLGGSGELARLLRTMAFAASPQFLWIAAALPLGSAEIVLALGIFCMTLIAHVVAIRQALGLGTGRAVAAFTGGFAIFVVAALVLGTVVGPLPGLESAPSTASGTAPGSAPAPQAPR